MNVNPKRQIVAGVGGGGVWTGQYQADGPVAMTCINPNAGNGPCWQGARVFLDDFARGLGTCQPDGNDYQPLGHNPLIASSYGTAADGVNWAAYLADGVTGVYTSWGFRLPQSQLAGVGPALFVNPTPGTDLAAYAIGALTPTWALPCGPVLDFFALDASRVLWTGGNRLIQVLNLPLPAQTEGAIQPSAFEALGQLWLATGTPEGGFIIRPWSDASQGYIVVPKGQNAFGPCVVIGNDANHVIAFWSPNAGETAVNALTVDLTAPMQPLLTPPLQPTFTFHNRLLIAPFKDPTGLSGQPPIESFGRVIETEGELGSIPADVRIIFIYDAPGRPVIPHGLPSWALFLVELYRLKSETLSQSVARWMRNVTWALAQWPGDLGVIPQMYGQGGPPPDELWTVPELLEGLAWLSEIVNLDSRIKVSAPFAYDRKNGIIVHPELQVAFSNMVAASPGVPVLASPPSFHVSSGGSILMADVKGVLNYFGSKDLGSGHVALYADKAHATVFSAQGDTRPANSIGAWETWKLSGQIGTASDGSYNNWVVVDVTGL